MIRVKVRAESPSIALPQYMTPGSSGCDVCAFVEAPVTMEPLARVAIPTGLFFEIPTGFEIQVRPRSGLSFKQGITVVNAPGTIDSDYRGELKILLVNLSKETVTIKNGDRIAQLVLQKVERVEWEMARTLEASERGVGGFGSTGVEAPRPS